MSDLQQTVERLNELHKQTTPGEWSADIGSSPLGQTGDFEPYADIECHGENVAYFNEMAGVAMRTGIDVQEGNAQFTAEIKNAWPAIASELTRLRESSEAAGLREAKLRDAVKFAGFEICEASGAWSIHDVSELAKRDEERTNQVISENLDLLIEIKRLREFEAAVRDATAYNLANNVPGMQRIYDSLNDLDRKRGGHDGT